jgi:regulator of nucleoside diphosphate kinase
MTDHPNDEGPRTVVPTALPLVCRAACAAGPLADLPVLITTRDYRRLRSLLSDPREAPDGAVLKFLAQRLGRAAVRQPNAVPSEAVTMNSRVRFRPKLGQPSEARTLVFDEEYSTVGKAVSILSPLGIALLGLRAGNTMSYVALAIGNVAYQPEREGRLLRAAQRLWPAGQRDRGGKERWPAPADTDNGRRTVVPHPPTPVPRPAAPDDDNRHRPEDLVNSWPFRERES